MAEYSRFAYGSYTLGTTGTSQVIYLPFQPTLVKLVNYSVYSGFTLHGIANASWNAALGQGTAAVEVVTTGPVLRTSIVPSNGISTFAAGTALTFGPAMSIVSIDKTTGTVTTTNPHGLSVGSVVYFQGLYQTSTTGMPQMAGVPIGVTGVPSATTFTINWQTNQSNYTSLTGSPAGAQFKQLYYPDLYLPGYNIITNLSFGPTTAVQCATRHNYVLGQEVALILPSAWVNAQPDPALNNVAPSSKVYGYVSFITNDFRFECTINTSNISVFNSNQPVSAVPGLNYPQVFAAGDVNTGGTVYSGGALYPSPTFPTFSLTTPTINGPAISGAFVNNTRQGFIIGAGAASADATSNLSGSSGQFLYWEASIPDYTFNQ